MGLFKKKVCVVCGKECGLLSRQKIMNDEYICSDCENRCGRLILSSTYKQMTRDDVIRQQEETDNNADILSRLFTETDYVDEGTLTGGRLLSVDANHGWITFPKRDRNSLFTFDQIAQVDVYLNTSMVRDDPPDEHGPHQGPQSGRDPHAPHQGPHRDMRGPVMPPPPPGLPACPPGQKIEGIFVRVSIVNSWITSFDMDVMNALIPVEGDITRGYNNAAHIVELLKWCKNEKRSQQAVQAAAQVLAQQQTQASAAAQTAAAGDVVAQIKQFKELLDMGAITQEEFDAKKKQLLGL